MVGSETGLFVTMFHARLELSTGRFGYVDAGHGYAAILRAGGDVALLGSRSLPLGVLEDEAFQEGVERLDPGDTLIVYSDGLVERDDHSLTLADLLSGLDG